MYKPLDPKKLSLAISADIMAMLTRSEVIGVFELRRIKHISDICIDLVNSVGTIHEGPAYMAVLRRIEDLCPNVNALLRERAFDGQAVLEASYETLKRGYSETFANEMRVLEAIHGEVQTDRKLLQLSQGAFHDNVTRFAALKAGVAPEDMRALAEDARAVLPPSERAKLTDGSAPAEPLPSSPAKVIEMPPDIASSASEETPQDKNVVVDFFKKMLGSGAKE